MTLSTSDTGPPIARSPDVRPGVLATARRHPVLSVLAAALVARLVVVIAIWLAFGGTVFNDDAYYVQLAGEAARGETAHWGAYPYALFRTTAAFLLPLTGLFALTGSSPLAGQLLVAAFGALAAAVTTRLCLESLPLGPSIAAGLVVALLPSQVFFSSLVLKDPQIWFILVGLGVSGAIISGEPRRSRIVAAGAVAVISLLLLAYLREHTLIVAAWSLVGASWFGHRRSRHVRLSSALLLAVTVPWLAGLGPGGIDFVANTGSLEYRRAANAENAATAIVAGRDALEPDRQRDGVVAEAPGGDLDDLGAPSGDLEDLGAPNSEVAEGATTDREPTQSRNDTRPGPQRPDSPREMVQYLPRGLAAFLFEPVPWRDGNARVRLAQAENMVWYILLALALVGVPSMLKAPRVWVYPLLVGGGLTVVYGLTEGNFGTAFRHRGEIIWVVAIASMFGVERLRSYVRDVRGVT